MKIIFYSTNTNSFDSSAVEITNIPENKALFDDFIKRYPKDTFITVSQRPALFMPERECIIADQQAGAEEIAEMIAKEKPDLAIAMTFWVAPFDWLTISDALVAEKLKEKGISTICNPLEAALICFDKNRTREFFEANNFNTPKTLFVDHDMFFCAGSQKEVLRNVYKESVFTQLKKMKLPLVIKDTLGLSSYSLAVVNTYGEAIAYLNSKKNNSNRIIQEFAEGLQVGVEVYGKPGSYTVLPPFIFSVNKYGITSPKQSVKFSQGSEWIKTKEFAELKAMLLSLSELLKFQGVAQIDLVLNQGKWKIIEINPRLSGMTLSYAASSKYTIFDTLYKLHDIQIGEKNYEPVLSIKLPPQEKQVLNKIKALDNSFSEVKIAHITQIYDANAKQEREKGWCEVIISGKNTSQMLGLVEKIQELFNSMKSEIPETQFPDNAIFEQSESMLKHPPFPEPCLQA